MVVRIIKNNIQAELKLIQDRVSLTSSSRKELSIVRDILDSVISDGDQALVDYSNRFDKAGYTKISDCLVTPQETAMAFSVTEDKTILALKRAIENITKHHERQKHSSWKMTHFEGAETGVRYSAISSAGLYVPGGTAAYPSSVLMNAIPAIVAGVDRIVMVTPPGEQGKLNPLVLVAAELLGIKEIYKIGGAQAIAALAYGTDSIKPVDKIVGPGNIWVTLAKKEVYGQVAIDKLAGPSDITVLADDNAPDDYIAADMLSQAEHDTLASAIAVVFSEEKANAVKQELQKQLDKLSRKEIAKVSLEKYGAIFIASNLDEMMKIANSIAPEHLELMFEDYEPLLPMVKNAGAIFCGYYCPEPLGDYYAGPNHVLPTGGTARFESPLGVDDFMKKTSLLMYTKEAAQKSIDDVELFARLEGLDAHANSMAIRRDL